MPKTGLPIQIRKVAKPYLVRLAGSRAVTKRNETTDEGGKVGLGYYRLLLGVPQKSFYGSGTGRGQFKSMEARGIVNQRQKDKLPVLCKAMSEGLAELVRQLSPRITPRDVAELPLLTIGAQFQGSNNNTIGRVAIVEVFLSIKEIVKKHIVEEEKGKFTLLNSAGRTVIIALASDPDVRIQEEFGGKYRNKVAIEIKGGTDKSNAHNRAGEAEKSHQSKKTRISRLLDHNRKKGTRCE